MQGLSFAAVHDVRVGVDMVVWMRVGVSFACALSRTKCLGEGRLRSPPPHMHQKEGRKLVDALLCPAFRACFLHVFLSAL